MNKLVVLGSDGIIFDIRPRESTFDYLLSALGKEAKKLTELYLQYKVKGPLLLAEKVKLFKGLSIDEVRKATKEFINKKIRSDFGEVLKELKERGYLIAIFTSNPIVPYKILKEKHPEIDFVFGTELEEENGICTGEYVPLSFPQDIEEDYIKEYPVLAQKRTTEPNRYGLAEKLFQLIKENEINISNSWLVWNKVTKVPMASILKNTVVFGPSDSESEEKYKVEGKELKEVLEFIE